MNIGGDGKDVWPWIGKPNPKGSPSNDNRHYDVGKLAQWEVVFAHAQRKGIALQVVFNEAEEPNKRELDDGELGVERKLYYREMIARFGHHPAVEWNLCEEYNIGGFNFGPDRVRAFARYVREVDPYDHPLTVHSAGDPVKALAFSFGDPNIDSTSVQLNQRRIDLVAEALRAATAKAGKPLPIMLDEFTVDKGDNASHVPRDDAELHRKQKIWPTYLSGGSIEFILEGFLDSRQLQDPAARGPLESPLVRPRVPGGAAVLGDGARRPPGARRSDDRRRSQRRQDVGDGPPGARQARPGLRRLSPQGRPVGRTRPLRPLSRLHPAVVQPQDRDVRGRPGSRRRRRLDAPGRAAARSRRGLGGAVPGRRPRGVDRAIRVPGLVVGSQIRPKRWGSPRAGSTRSPQCLRAEAAWSRTAPS